MSHDAGTFPPDGPRLGVDMTGDDRACGARHRVIVTLATLFCWAVMWILLG